jgi:hypothetical protein
MNVVNRVNKEKQLGKQMLLRELFESKIILEYNRKKTADAFGSKIMQAFIADRGHQDGYALAIKNRFTQGQPLTPEIQEQVVDYLLTSFERVDPTSNNEYVQWLAKVYANGRIMLEDIRSKGADWLLQYDNLKKRKLLPVEVRDIGRLSFSQLGDIAINPEYASKLDAAADKTVNKGTANEVYNDDQIRVIHPADEAAACYYGQGTQWCTAASKNNMFSHYAEDGELYILIPKQPKYAGEKYQLHFESSSFMNERDISIDMVELFKRFPQLRKVFDNNKFIFDADDWYTEEEMQNFRKSLPEFEKVLLKESRLLASHPIEQLLRVKDTSIFKNIPGLEDEIFRLFKEGWFVKKSINAIFNIALMTKPEQLSSFIQHINQQEEEFYNNEERDIDDEFTSYWTVIKNSCARLMWDYWKMMIAQNISYKPIMNAIAVAILRSGLDVWQKVITGEQA